MSRFTNVDIAVFDINSGDFLEFMSGVTYATNFDTEDGAPINVLGNSPCPVKQGATLSTPLMSNSSTSCRVSNLDVSAITLDGQSIAPFVRGGSFNGTLGHEEGSGIGDRWKLPIVVSKDFSISLDLVVPTASNPIAGVGGFADSVHGNYADIVNTSMVFSITINGIAVTLPTLVSGFEQSSERGAIQRVNMELMGKAPWDTSAYPTAPTGTTSLLEKALNDPKTPLAIELDFGTGNNNNYSGNFVISGFNFGFNDSEIIKTQYDFASSGEITYA